MSEKDAEQLFELEWNQAVANNKEWCLKEGDLEFAAVSAYCILNYTANDTEVCAIDSYGAESGVAEWFRPGSTRWLVWDACKGALAKGIHLDPNGGTLNRIGIKRLFLLEETVFPNNEAVSLINQGNSKPLSETATAFMAAVWAQSMIGIKVAILGKGEYLKTQKSTKERLGGYPDYMIIRDTSGNSSIKTRCVGWIPQGVWYPDERKWGAASAPNDPCKHFDTIWQIANNLAVNGTTHLGHADTENINYDPDMALVTRVRRLLGCEARPCPVDASACKGALMELDEKAFSAFSPRWERQIRLLMES